ncbi:hypothetical protein [Pseudalkalibacillus hwajinpoensis]|uniref:hypothetical protein n=1 Tax=Guptibacillus hwajinpoensis TaxID=208199 RepID=UPI002AA5BCD2
MEKKYVCRMVLLQMGGRYDDRSIGATIDLFDCHKPGFLNDNLVGVANISVRSFC